MYYFAIIILSAFSFLTAKVIVERRSAAVVYGLQTIALLVSIAAFIFLFARKIGNLHSIEPWFLIRFLYLSIMFLAPAIFLFVFTIGILIISRKPSRKYSPILPSIMIWIALSLLFTGVYAKKIEPFWIEVTNHTIRTDKLKKNSIRIVQLSDIHLDELGKREKKTLKILKQLDPDFIFLTGDYLNNTAKQKELNQFMKSLKAKKGVYAVRGNWEGVSKLPKYFEGTNIQIIDNQTINIKFTSEKISITGIHWVISRNNMPVHIKPISEDNSYNIVLCHYPDISINPPKWADLILAGHTHGGQVRLPFIGPLVTFSKVSRKNAAGMSEMPNGGKLYVNRGLGMEGDPTPRIRFLCRPEIAVFEIKPK